MSTKTRIAVFLILLVAIFAVLILYGSGVLRFGLEGVFSFVVYVLLGLLSALICFGFLSSYGEITGNQYSMNLKVGGAIVALILVAGGGIYYERYLKTSSSFDIRINFYKDQKTRLSKVTGTLNLFYGNQTKTVNLSEQETILIQGIPVQWLSDNLKISLSSNRFEIDPSSLADLKLGVEQPIYLKLQNPKSFANPEEANIELYYDNGFAVDYIRRPGEKNVFFTLQAKSNSDYTVPISKKAELEIITNSGMTIYKTELESSDNIYVPPNALSDLVFEGFIPNTEFELARTNKLAFINIYYNEQIQKSDASWALDFEFNSESVKSQ